MRIVIALGGNALLKRCEPLSAENQRRNMRAAADALARACEGHEVAIVHGNGPQVGLLALEADAYKALPPYPLDVLGAESQGMIGYVIAQELRNASPGRPVGALITQTIVDPGDPAFSRPSKPIGPVYNRDEVEALKALHGWTFARDGKAMRRVVPSPKPMEIVELPLIEDLVARGVTVVCAGGGGIPVYRKSDGQLAGVEAVIDKDLAASLLAERIAADRLVILTDVDAVYLDWGKAQQTAIGKITSAELRRHLFADGSMAPKVTAACDFAERTGRPAAIGSLVQAREVLSGQAGTIVHD
ncbi:MAG: carbamate kinase [Proteobacteria bacterium]|nr:carbamate kinase [Pseudomonadota bacterium]